MANPEEKAQLNESAVVEKRDGDWTSEQITNGDAPEPYEVVGGENQDAE